MAGLLLGLLAPAAGTAAEQPQVTISADTGTLAQPAPVGLTVVYRWPRDWQPVAPPSPAAAFARSTVLACTGPERVLGGGEERWTYHLRVRPGAGAAYVSPPLRFTLRGPPSQLVTVEADPVVVLIGAATVLGALPPLLPPPQRVWGWWLAGGAVALLLALVTIAWRIRAAPPASPLAVLLRELERARTLVDGRAAATQASLALRQFAGLRAGFSGIAATPAEIRERLAGACPEAQGRELERLLLELEAWRWRRGQPPAAVVGSLCQAARQWALALPPREPPP